MRNVGKRVIKKSPGEKISYTCICIESETRNNHSGLNCRVRFHNSMVHLESKTMIPKIQREESTILCTLDGGWMQKIVTCQLTLDPKACNFNIVSTVKRPVNKAFI